VHQTQYSDGDVEDLDPEGVLGPYYGHTMRKQHSCLEKEIMQAQCQVHAGKEDHAWPGWTTSICGEDSLLKSQSERQRTEINGESTYMV